MTLVCLLVLRAKQPLSKFDAAANFFQGSLELQVPQAIQSLRTRSYPGFTRTESLHNPSLAMKPEHIWVSSGLQSTKVV